MSKNKPSTPLLIGTRGSKLALWQAHWVANQLSERGVKTEVVIIKTSGDKNLKGSLADQGGKGLFIKELEQALLDGAIHLAVHSLKDVPSKLEDPFTLAAFLPRADPRDCLVSSNGYNSVRELPDGAKVGSCSPRRIAQALHLQPELEILPLRGNVETRLRKVAEGELDATFLAKAGLDRLNLYNKSTIKSIDSEEMLPAAGQGIVVIETLQMNKEVQSIVSLLDTPTSRRAGEAERYLVECLHGSCNSPIGAYAELNEGMLVLQGRVGSLDGKNLISVKQQAICNQHLELAESVAQKLLSQGAADLF